MTTIHYLRFTVPMLNDVGIWAWAVTAALVGLIHTLTGPDHYVPFVVMARAGRWTLRKALLVTLACGVGHVLSSVVLGSVGIAIGVAVGKLEWIEGLRGDLAAWLVLGFGVAYTAWGVRQAIRNRPHRHWHAHADGTLHEHDHTHQAEHVHVHADAPRAAAMTPWLLFTLFIFGPCEPLIPLLMAPAARSSAPAVALVTAVFGIVTLATMVGVVACGYLGLSRIAFARLERYGHALAGLAIVACGTAMKAGL